MNWLSTHTSINTVSAVKHSTLAGFVLSFNNSIISLCIRQEVFNIPEGENLIKFQSRVANILGV